LGVLQTGTMQLSFLQLAAVGFPFLGLAAAANPVCQQKLSPRPTLVAAPHAPAIAHFKSPQRTKVCYVRAKGNGQDDSQTLFSAAKACNNGGVVALIDPLYTIAKPLDLTFLNAVDFDIQGTITFTTDTTYWMANSFKYAFQSGSCFWQWGGYDVNWYGGGTIDGAGQTWYDLFAKNSTIARPLLFVQLGMQHASMSNIHMKNPPNWFNFISNSSDIIVSNMTLTAYTTNSNPVKNSGSYF
jgi:galacturan 1,4-alpha-galacturonidase